MRSRSTTRSFAVRNSSIRKRSVSSSSSDGDRSGPDSCRTATVGGGSVREDDSARTESGMARHRMSKRIASPATISRGSLAQATFARSGLGFIHHHHVFSNVRANVAAQPALRHEVHFSAKRFGKKAGRSQGWPLPETDAQLHVGANLVFALFVGTYGGVPLRPLNRQILHRHGGQLPRPKDLFRVEDFDADELLAFADVGRIRVADSFTSSLCELAGPCGIRAHRRGGGCKARWLPGRTIL